MRRYKRINVNGSSRPEHRVIWEKANGPIPPGYVIHHINGNGRDNRLENLMMMAPRDHVALHARMRREGTDPVDQNDPAVIACHLSCAEYRKRNKESVAKRKAAYAKAHQEEIAKYQANYRREHKQYTLDYAARYRSEHRDEISRKKKAYYYANKDKIDEYCIKYHEANKARISAQRAEFRAKPREELAALERLRRAISSNKPDELIAKLRSEYEEIRARTRGTQNV